MPFLTKGKTNWKFLLIVIILAVIVGGGSLLYVRRPEKPYQPVEIKKTAIPKNIEVTNIEVTNELANKIMDKVVPTNYDRKTACFLADDLDGDNTTEIFIGALKITPIFDEVLKITLTPAYEAYLAIVKPTDESGNYKKIADITLNKEGNFVTSVWGEKRNIDFLWEGNSFCNKNNFIDIDKDGKKEIFPIVYTGADHIASGIFKIDWDLGKIDWVKIKKKDGSLEHTYFEEGGGAANPIIFATKDFDLDGINELITEYLDCTVSSIVKQKGCDFDIAVYKWDGSIFNYSKEFSELLQSNPDLVEINHDYVHPTP